MNGVNIAQVMAVSRCRYASMPAELAGCIALAAADAIVAAPKRLEANHVALFEDGSVRISDGVACSQEFGAYALRQLLDALLDSACSVTPALLRTARREGNFTISALVHELEIALVPTNRGAAKRALSRLCREVSRAFFDHPKLSQPTIVTSLEAPAHSTRPSKKPPQNEEIDLEIDVSLSADISRALLNDASAPLNSITSDLSPWASGEGMGIPDLEPPCIRRHITETRPPDQASLNSEPERDTQQSRLSEVMEICDKDMYEISDCEIETSLTCVSDELTCQLSVPEMLDTMDSHLSPTEPFPLIVMTSARSSRESNLPRSSEHLAFCETLAEGVDVCQALANSSCGSSVDAAEGPRHESVVFIPVTGPHNFMAPARFTKKPTAVSERLASLTSPKVTEPDALIDRLRSLAELSQESAPSLGNPKPVAEFSAASHRPDSSVEP